MGKLQIIDISIVLTYLTLCLVIGLYKFNKIKDIREYAIGNKNFSTFVIIATIFATFMSANQIIGKTEQIHKLGLVYALAILFTPFNWLIVRNIYAKNIGKFRGCISMSEIMGRLYGNIGLNLTNIVLVLKAIGFTAVQITAIGYLFNYFFNFTYTQGVLIGMSIVTFYSVLGGVRAVALTDAFQFLIFFVALPLACGYAYIQAGEYENIINSVPKTHIEVFTNANSTLLFLAYTFWIILPAISTPYTQRLLMAKNRKQLMDSYNVLICGSIFFAVVIFVLGFSIRVIYPNIDAKMAFYTFIGDLPPIFIGLMITGMLAVIMSTADSWLNALSVIVSHDVIKKIYPQITEKTELLFARLATFLCSIFAVIIALKSGEIFKLIIFFESFSYTTILIPFTVGFFSFKTNKYSFLASFMSGFLGTLIVRLYVGEFGIISLVVGTFSSAIGLFSAHYIQVRMGIIKKKEKYNDLFLKRASSSLIKRVIKHFKKFFLIKEESMISNPFYYTISLFFVALNMPVLILGYFQATDYVNIIAQYSRYLVLLLALIVMIHELIGIKKVYILWYTTLFFALPFSSTYLFISSGYKLAWGINCVFSMVALLVFIHRLYAFILATLGVCIAVGFYKIACWVEGYHILLDENIDVRPFALYSITILLFAMLYLIVKRQKEDKILEESLQSVANSLIHEVSAPLFSNIGSINLVKRALGDKNYDKVNEYLNEMRTNNYVARRNVSIFLNNMAYGISDHFDNWREYSARTCLVNVLKYIPMIKEEKARISIVNIDNKQEDFKFLGSEILMGRVLLNLIQNALIHAGNDAKVELFILDNKIYVKDNGTGIPDHMYDKLFQRNTLTVGRGSGLYFCKQAMLKMEGNIDCISKEGEGTQFILSFNK